MVYADNISDQLTTLLGSIVAVAAKVVIFLLILVLGWIVGNWIYKWLGGFLRRVGFDRAADRGGLHRILGDTKASDLMGRLVELAFLLFVLQLAFGIFGPNPVSELIRNVVAWLPKLFVAVIIFVVAAAIAGLVKQLIRNAMAGVSFGPVLGVAAQVAILALGIIAALNQIGVADSVTLAVLIAALATISGIAIVGVGGGLVRPMQHRWERMLNRAETETALAAQQVRTRRTAEGVRDRNVNEPGGFGQPPYPGGPPSDTEPSVEEQEHRQRGE